MATRAVSIEISQVVTKICEVDSNAKNPKVYKSFMIPTPKEMITDGMLQQDENYVTALREALAANKIKAKKVIFSITSTRIASREVTIPYVKENKIEKVVNAQAEEYFPVDLSDYKVTYSLLGTTVDDKGNQRHRLLILAVPTKLLQGYYDLAAACGLEIIALDYMGNSIFQAVKNTCLEGTRLVAKIDEHSTLLMILQDGHLVSIRNVTYGVDEAIHTLWEKEHGNSPLTDYGSVVDELRNRVYIQDNIGEKGAESGRPEEDSVGAVTGALEYLVNGISRVIDFYNPRSNGHPIEKMYITGLGGSFQGMSELLQARLSIPVAVLRDIDGLVMPKDFDTVNLGDYIACIGASMQPLDMLLTSGKESERGIVTSGRGNDNTGLAAIICAGGVIIACILAVVALIPYKQAQMENQRLQNRIVELKPVEEIHNTYVAAQGLWTDADNMYALTENHNDNLIAFIQELEQKMPSDIIVLSMVASPDNVVLNINVSSKESAAKVLQTLDTFESIEIVQTTGISDAKDIDDVHVVSFSVTCVYAQQQETVE